jgi:hypothetical protein
MRVLPGACLGRHRSTRGFYENVLGFRAVRCDILKVKEGGQIRHVFFDTGRDQLLAFMEARAVPGVPAHATP